MVQWIWGLELDKQNRTLLMVASIWPLGSMIRKTETISEPNIKGNILKEKQSSIDVLF